MSRDVRAGKWKQVRSEAKAWWGRLTDDDLDRGAGKLDVLGGLLPEKYGYIHPRAVEEADKRVTGYEAGLKAQDRTPPQQATGALHGSLLVWEGPLGESAIRRPLHILRRLR